jgi:hypothetical protein
MWAGLGTQNGDRRRADCFSVGHGGNKVDSLSSIEPNRLSARSK